MVEREREECNESHAWIALRWMSESAVSRGVICFAQWQSVLFFHGRLAGMLHAALMADVSAGYHCASGVASIH